MDRLRAAFHAWERLERRTLPRAVPRWLKWLLGCLLLLVLAGSLFRDVAYLLTIPIDDIRAYECYARAFWQGSQAVVAVPHTRLCAAHAFQFWTAPPRALHTLPREYPAPALAVFSLPLLAWWAPYNLTFMTMLAMLVFSLTAWLGARRGLIRAVACGLYLLVGGWATVLARYDLVPGVLVLAALVLAERRRFGPAYLLLAAGTLLKVFPIFLVAVLFVHQTRTLGRRSWQGLLLFVGVVACGFLPGALLDPANFWQPLGYNGQRPPQIESVAGSLLWLIGRVGGGVRVRLTYHSLNVTGAFSGLAAWLATAALLAGLALAAWRAWTGRDEIGRSFVLALLVILCGSKLLSPQYMLWLFPTVAYVEGLRVRWLLLAALTVAIYPYAYGFGTSLVRLPEHPVFMESILCRNGVLVAITIAYMRPLQVFRGREQTASGWQRAAARRVVKETAPKSAGGG